MKTIVRGLVFGLALSSALATASGPQAGGTATIALWQEPENLNPYLAIQTVSRVLRGQTLEGLFAVNPDGNFVPVLAAEIPTTENGGVSADGKTVTVRLKEGLKWQDGHPVTAADIRFTWQVVMDETNPVSGQAGYDQITAIETPDNRTAVITFGEVYAPYLTLFSVDKAVLPAHYFGGDTDVSRSDFNRIPEGTGPWMVTAWESGNFMSFAANPNYREAGQPYLEQLIYKFVPSREVATAQLRTGEVQGMWNLIENQLPQLKNAPGIELVVTDSTSLEFLGLNTQNPILEDARVREAIGLAIDKTVLVERLLYGRASVAQAPITLGWARDESIQANSYDPERANALLDEAGWAQRNADGVRTKDGQTLTVSVMTPTGDQLRALAEQVIQEQLRGVGVDLSIGNVPANVMFAVDGPLKTGDFDIAMDTWGPDVDPGSWLSLLFASSSIPTEANPNAGWNFIRLNSPEVDAGITAGNSTLDLEARKAAYARAQQGILDSQAYIPLYTRFRLDAFTDRLSGYAANPWNEFGWDSGSWYLSH